MLIAVGHVFGLVRIVFDAWQPHVAWIKLAGNKGYSTVSF